MSLMLVVWRIKMSKDIKEKIDKLNEQLEQVLTPDIFTLNPEAVKITKEIARLQSQCNHNFVDGKCEFCYLEECNE